MNFFKINNDINDILKNKIVIRWFIFSIAFVIISSLSWIWLNPKENFTSPESIQTDVFIMGGSLGAAMSAIQLSRDNIPFVLVEPTQWLGGQATIQSVSTLDQNNRAFQQSGIYAELVQSLKVNPELPGFYGNALTGPGATPEIIDSWLKNQIKSSNAKILYDSELLDIKKQGSKILSARVRNKKIINSQFNIEAKLFLDGADLAELSRTAGINYSIGLDKQEETKEPQALTEAENKIFKEGVINSNNQPIGGFKDVIQPVTVPFTIVDKGYFGDMINWNSFAQEVDKIKCQNLVQECWNVNSNSSFEIKANPLPIWLSFVAFGNEEFQIQVNDKEYKPTRVDKKISENAIQLRFEIDSNDRNVQIKFLPKKNQSILISHIFTSNFNQIQPSESDSVGDLFKKTKLKIDPVYKRNQAKFEWFGNQKEINSNQEYIIFYIPSDNKVDVPREVFFNIAENGKEITDFKFNPILDYFPGYLPIRKVKFNPESKYTVSVSGTSKDGLNLGKNVLIVPANQVNNLIVLNPGDTYSFLKNGLFDTWQIGGFTSELEVITRDSKSLIPKEKISNPINPSKAVNFLDRYIFPAESSIYLRESENKGQVFVRKLNLDHYAKNTWSNLSESTQEEINNLDPGKYEAYAFYQNDENSSQGDKVTVNLELSGKTAIKRNIPLFKSLVEKIGEFDLTELSKGKLSVQSSCPYNNKCLENLQIVLMESTPALYNPNRFDALINNTNDSEKKLLVRDIAASSMFDYRQIIDYANIGTWNKLNNDEKTQITSFSLGISQINTGFNDYTPPNLNYTKYLEDPDYRKEIYETAKNLSKQYYYWLKYDDPINHLGCENTDIFCSGLRISKATKASLDNDAYSVVEYIRDPVRLQGEKQITFNQIAWENNACTEISFSCIELKFKDSSYLVNKDFLINLPKRSIAPFYYPTDVHGLVKQGGTSFLNYLVENNFRDLKNQPSFINGMYDLKIKPSSVSLDNIYNSKIDNLLFCGKNISISQIANGSTRLHPSEAAIGQACGIIATTMIKDSLKSVSVAATDENFGKIRKKLVQSNIYTTPLEDISIENFKNKQQYDLLEAVYFALEDNILNVKISQDKNLSGVILSADLNGPASYEDLVRLFSKTTFFSIDNLVRNDKYKFLDLKNILDEKQYELIANASLEFRSKQKDKDIEKIESLQNITITRGDITYIYFTLIN
jgi:hypothetical protein